jgi:hypothetical protein
LLKFISVSKNVSLRSWPVHLQLFIPEADRVSGDTPLTSDFFGFRALSKNQLRLKLVKHWSHRKYDEGS